MMKLVSILSLLFAIVFGSCTNTTSEQQEDSTAFVQDTLSTSLPVPDYDYAADSTSSEEISIADYLIGRWQSVDDTSNIVVFDGNLRSERAGGMKEWDREEFLLSDVCMNASNKDSKEAKEKDRYISCVKSDMCWYIISVDKETLSLSYIGRGNTLIYRRMEDDM
jgi:hypothetical protein